MIPLFLNLGTQEMLLLLPILVTGLLYVWGLFHCLTNNKLQGNSKLLWVIIILIAPFIGAIIYFLAGRKGNLTA